MSTGASANFHALVEVELNRERASALGRAGRRVNEAIEACSRARAALDEACGDGGRAPADRAALDRAMNDYCSAYAGYQQARRDFCIQREANRLYDQSMIDRFYPPPDPPARLPR